jgi:hypothetical protein
MGALALVIIDYGGHCTKYDQACLPGSDKEFGDGFASSDVPEVWKDIKIPLFVMTKPSFDSLLLDIQRYEEELNISHLKKNYYDYKHYDEL